MRYIETLTTDERRIANPTWDDVEREIDALDGSVRTTVMLEPPPPEGPPDGDHHFAVGGGLEGRFLVYTTEDNLAFWSLVDPERRDARTKLRMNIGGQEGEFVESQFVSRALALRAARRYFDDGQRATDCIWIAG